MSGGIELVLIEGLERANKWLFHPPSKRRKKPSLTFYSAPAGGGKRCVLLSRSLIEDIYKWESNYLLRELKRGVV
ncbi:MAG TPA: hypothetical protein VKO43_03090 [Candidatus Krumholzibacteriaceae bacterium]|nr:hypothetical protein [Candidatus Krumholzibacteriaceae bacterium]